jgi:hypothetical protein
VAALVHHPARGLRASIKGVQRQSLLVADRVLDGDPPFSGDVAEAAVALVDAERRAAGANDVAMLRRAALGDDPQRGAVPAVPDGYGVEAAITAGGGEHGGARLAEELVTRGRVHRRFPVGRFTPAYTARDLDALCSKNYHLRYSRRVQFSILFAVLFNYLEPGVVPVPLTFNLDSITLSPIFSTMFLP